MGFERTASTLWLAFERGMNVRHQACQFGGLPQQHGPQSATRRLCRLRRVSGAGETRERGACWMDCGCFGLRAIFSGVGAVGASLVGFLTPQPPTCNAWPPHVGSTWWVYVGRSGSHRLTTATSGTTKGQSALHPLRGTQPLPAPAPPLPSPAPPPLPPLPGGLFPAHRVWGIRN